MRLTLILLIVVLVSPMCLLGQEGSQAQAWLIRSRFGGGDVGHYTVI